MARRMAKKARKSVTKSSFRSPSLSKPAKFPLHQLPAELVHMIFSYLTPTEIASARLLSSNIAAIGLKHIAITVTLTLQEDSFDRLLDIAYHPVVSKSVRTLYYEHGSLQRFTPQDWELSIRTPKHVAAMHAGTLSVFPGNNRSKRGERAFHRARNACKAYNTYGRKRLDQAFSSYQKHCAEEDRARRSGFFLNKLIGAVQHLPNLEFIYILSGSCRRYKAELANILKGALYHQHINRVHNIAVTRSVLDAVDRVVRDSRIMNGGATNFDNGPALIAESQDLSTASDGHLVMNDPVKFGPGDGTSNRYCPEFTMPGRSQSVLQIKYLVLEDFDWRLLLEDVQVFSAMKRSLSHLTKFEVLLLNGSHNGSTKMNDLLHEFVKLAPGLEELRVSLKRGPHPLESVFLPNILGSFHWASLKTIHFSEISFDVGTLQEFCSRHSPTLSKFCLGNVFMGGDTHVAGRDAWYSMFTKIREDTKFDRACVYGCLEHEQDEYYMENRADIRRASGTLIGRYLVGQGGRSSLKDFMRDERRRIPRQDRSFSSSDTETEWSEFSTIDGEDSSSDDDA